jgi:low temperature requirement protein LtrA
MTISQPGPHQGDNTTPCAQQAGDRPHQGDNTTPAAQAVGDQPIRVTTLELFFDLIFAFTLTQLAVVLTPGKTNVWATSVFRVLLIFGLLWWMYGGYAWLTNTRSPVRNPERLLLVFGMTGFLIAGLAIPEAFGGDGVAFGLGYLLVVLVHAVLYARVNRQIWRIAPFNVTSALLVIAAGFASGSARYVFWLAALVIQAGAPLVVRLGGRFEIRPGHFAERHGALIIVAIGESVAAIGIGAIGRPVTIKLVVAAVAGLALSVALWWMYFGSGDDERGEQAMRAAAETRRPGLALSAYFYAHMPMLLGIVFAAAGVTEAVRQGAGSSAAEEAVGQARGVAEAVGQVRGVAEAVGQVRGVAEAVGQARGVAEAVGLARAGGWPAALALGIGAAAFVGGTAAFRAALRTGPTRFRLAAAAFALATVPLGALVAIEAQLGLITAGLAVMLVTEPDGQHLPRSGLA